MCPCRPESAALQMALHRVEICRGLPARLAEIDEALSWP